MSKSPINLDLDFQDYAPSSESGRHDDLGLTRSQSSNAVVRISESTKSSGKSQQIGSGNSILNVLQRNSTSRSNISDESLRQLAWASRAASPSQPNNNQSNLGWGLGYFSRFYDVTTSDVIERILWSALPLRKKAIEIDGLGTSDDLITPLADPSGRLQAQTDRFVAKEKSHSYMERFIQSRPDFYGPIWISATLVFAVAIFSNMVSFLEFQSKSEHTILSEQGDATTANRSAENLSHQVTSHMEDWHYSIDELNIMSSAVLIYVTLLPTTVWFLFWFHGCSRYYTLSETICAYGYSLSIFIPLSAFLMIQFTPFRYIAVTLASLASGSVLTLSFLPVAKSGPNAATSIIILAIIPICHLTFGYATHRIMLQ